MVVRCNMWYNELRNTDMDDCLVLVGSRNGFERVVIEIK